MNPLVCAAIWCATVAEFPVKNQDRLPIEPKRVQTEILHIPEMGLHQGPPAPGTIAAWALGHDNPWPRKPGQSDLDYLHDFMSR